MSVVAGLHRQPLPATGAKPTTSTTRLVASAGILTLCVAMAGLGALGVGRTSSPLSGAAVMTAGVVVLGAVLLRRWLPEVCTGLFVALLYTNALVIAHTYHGVPQSVVGLSYLLLAVPLVAFTLFRREPIVITPALVLSLVYTAALFVSAAYAQNVHATLKPIANFASEGLVLFFLMSNAVRTPAAIRNMVWALIASAALLSVLSVGQEVTGSYDNDLAGFAQTNEAAVKVGEDSDGKILRDRLGGPLGSPNRYGQILAMVVPMALLQALHARRRSSRALAAAAATLMLVAIALTFSRGTAVALGGVVVVMLLSRVIRVRHVAALVVACTLVAVAVPQYVARLASLDSVEGLASEQVQPDGAVLGRATSNLASLSVFLDHPVVGVGPLQYFQQYSRSYANQLDLRFFEGRRRAHNLYFELAADTGLLGLLTFLAVPLAVGFSLRRAARRLKDRRPDDAHLAYALLFGLVSYFASAVFLHLAYQRYLWLLLGLANAAAWVHRREAADATATGGPDVALPSGTHKEHEAR
ncbi:MAG: O-antigen ligase family protein [Egibacteraceae bacterium]